MYSLVFSILLIMNPSPYDIQVSNTELTSAEQNGLLLMREEEKLARDVYAFLGDKWEKQIFFNIGSSEQRHMDAVKALLTQFDLPDPISDDVAGVFENKELQKLYNELTEKGSKSLVDALLVGATIEDLDIFDLTKLISETQHKDLLKVYNNLNRGSRNHMRAFSRQLQRQDAVYTPQYISQEAYDEIINRPQEKGSCDDSPQGKAKKKGKCSGKKACDSSKCSGKKKKCQSSPE